MQGDYDGVVEVQTECRLLYKVWCKQIG